MRIVKCLNCGTCFRGKYCPWCGQQASTGRLNWRTLIDQVTYSITNIESGIGRTMKDLFSRPGHMMRDFIAGKRVIYFKPFSMLVVLGGIYVILSTFLKHTLGIDGAGVTVEIGDDIAQELFEDRSGFTSAIFLMLENAFSNPVFWSLLMIPFFALTTRWVFRKEGARNYNYVEFLYVCAYMACQRFVIDILFLPYELLGSGDETFSYSFFVVLGYIGLTAWDFKQFFRIKWVKLIRKSIRLFIEAFVLAFLVLLVILILIILIGIGLAFILKIFRGVP